MKRKKQINKCFLCDNAVRAKGLCQTHYNSKMSKLRPRTDLHNRWIKLKSQCKKRQQNLELTEDQFKTIASKPCFYCKKPFITKGSGLDRINPYKGYTKNNSVSCCWECNRIKGKTLTANETKAAIQAIEKTRKKAYKSSYVCGVDFQHEIGNGPNDIKLYSSLDVLKKERTCWKECGIVELEISVKKWIEPQNLFTNIRKKSLTKSNKKSIVKKGGKS